MLHQIVRSHRERAVLHTIIYLDLKKAFDSVFHSSLTRVLRGYGVHDKVFEYVAANYRNVTTTISVQGEQTGVIKLNRRVNLVVDE